MDFSWSEEQLTYKNSVIKFAQKELNEGLIERDKKGELSRQNWQKCAQFGLLGLATPEEYGGAGADILTTMLVMEGFRQKDIFTVSEDLSLYNIFAALFFAQLHYMSNNRRLGFITPVHNRFAEKFKQIIGLIMELCPLQVEIEANDTFLSLINKVKRETRETLSYYQYGSAISLQNEAFDVMFNTHHMPNLNLNGIPVRVERIHPGHGSESLALHVHDFADSGNLVLNFYFHKDVFDQTQCNQIVQSFVELTDAFLENNAQLINEASLPFTQLIRPSSTNGPTRHDNPEYNQISLQLRNIV